MFLKSNNFSSSHQKQQRIENYSLVFQGLISVKCCITATQAQSACELNTALTHLVFLELTEQHGQY